MCGIVGYIGPRDATPIILNGLKRLEYRGYDSAGLAVLENSHIEVRRDVGKLSRLSALVDESPLHGHVGIGHTRWATHGEPSARNAHPHLGMTGDVVVVHNGIVENYLELRDELAAEGVVFNSDTDTEVIVHLVERYLGAETGMAFSESGVARGAMGIDAALVGPDQDAGDDAHLEPEGRPGDPLDELLVRAEHAGAPRSGPRCTP